MNAFGLRLGTRRCSADVSVQKRAVMPPSVALLIARSAGVTCTQDVPADKRPSLPSLDSLEKAPGFGGNTRFLVVCCHGSAHFSV